jgi:Ca-activated chloride channel family protein
VLVVAAVAALATAVVVWAVGTRGSGTSPADAAGAGDGRSASANCVGTAALAVPKAYLATWSSVVAAHATWQGQGCAPLTVVARASADMATGAVDGADGWIPEDASWVGRVTGPVKAALPTASAPVVASTPLALSMPTEMAKALGWPGPLTPAVLTPMVTLDQTWANHGHKEWGNLRLALPDPTADATGTLGFAALMQLTGATASATGPNYLNPSPADLALIRLEHRVAATSTDAAATLSALGPLDATGVGADDPRGPGAALTTEQVLVTTTQPSGRSAFYLGQGAASLRMPLVVLTGPRSGPVASLVTFLQSDPGRAALATAGLRSGTSGPSAEAITAGGLAPGTLLPAVELGAEQATGVATLFGYLHSRVSSLMVLDMSGSMKEVLGSGRTSKIDLVRTLARTLFAVASPHARTGLLTFRSDPANSPLVSYDVPLGENDALENGAAHVDRMYAIVDNTAPSGGTPLYNAILTGYQNALDAWTPGYLNQVVVLTDGANRDAKGSITEAGLLAQLASRANPAKPVRIVLVGYGPDADMGTLQRIAAATGGKTGWVRTPEELPTAAKDALFSL